MLRDLEDDGDDNEEGGAVKEGTMRTKNELPADVSPVKLSDVSISVTTPIERLGSIEKVMDSVVVVKADVGGEYRILDEGTIIVTDARDVIGSASSRYGISLIFLGFRDVWSCTAAPLCNTACRERFAKCRWLERSNSFLCR